MALGLLLGYMLLTLSLAGESTSPSNASGPEPSVNLSKLTTHERACTLDELLPRPNQEEASEWSHGHVVNPPHGCRCATLKGRWVWYRS